MSTFMDWVRSLPGARPVDPTLMEAYRTEMIEKVIPAIEAAMREQHRLRFERPEPIYGIIDPDYGRAYTIIRKLAWEEGYAIGLHGSFTRDLDLVAVPWTEKPSEPEHLVRRILAATSLESIPGNPGKKPQGRLVWTLMFPDFGDPRFIDLSVLPVAQLPELASAGSASQTKAVPDGKESV